MPVLDRIQQMLHLAGSSNQLFPATILYNEGWLLRLVLDWFSNHRSERHPLAFAERSRWFSEALLPSQFFARSPGDRLAEGPTHADGVIGHFLIGDLALADTKLAEGARQFLITEAKLFSPLSSGVTNAAYFDQAARNVACLAEVLYRAVIRPDQLGSLGFFVLSPAEQISAGVFQRDMSGESVKAKVSHRVSEYSDPSKGQWLREWFLPTLQHTQLGYLSWESLLEHIMAHDTAFATELRGFYVKCLQVNRVQEREPT